ncbi:O-antigen ligase family protein [Rhodoferax ferrireducens]|uniref:O-antigen ligase family protein n=1 Tax=Rhodoferax ferrireducens TaxID=192843 RepID=UPI000E0D0FFF|nr:O-antigen ligase family protein [Rhodoferax ferrireducens]
MPEVHLNKGNALANLFSMAWLVALLLLVLNLGVVAGLGNINALEKSLFLAAGLIYLANKPKNWGASITALVILLTIFLGAVFTEFFAFSWGRAASAATALFALVPFFLARPSERERNLALKSIAVLPFILVSYSLVLWVAMGIPIIFRDHTGAQRLGGALHPAFLAAACYAGALSSAFLYSQHKSFRYLALCTASLVICLLSGTRMPSVCAAASCALVIVGATRGGASRIGFIGLGLTAIVIFLLTFGDQILVRFMSGSTSGREDMWAALGEWIARYPLAGVGFGHHGLLIPESITKITRTSAAHNEYLRSLVELGYLGAPVFLGSLFLLFVQSSANALSKITLQTLALVLLLFVYASTDNVFFLSYCLLIPLVISWGPSAAIPSRGQSVASR